MIVSGAAAVAEPLGRAKNMSLQLADIYRAACPTEGCRPFREPSPHRPDWAGMNLSPKRWFTVVAADLPPGLLARACKLVLVDYCCFDVALPPPCASAGLSCDGGGLPDWEPSRNLSPPRKRREAHDCCDLRKKPPRPAGKALPPKAMPPRDAPPRPEPPLDPAVAARATTTREF